MNFHPLQPSTPYLAVGIGAKTAILSVYHGRPQAVARDLPILRFVGRHCSSIAVTITIHLDALSPSREFNCSGHGPGRITRYSDVMVSVASVPETGLWH
jgi:hypothetical protein